MPLVLIGDRTDLILERIPGKTLIALAASKLFAAFLVRDLISKLQLKMHNTHTDKIRSYKKIVLDALNSEPLFLWNKERQIAANKIGTLSDGDSILHFDYHPDNIMSDGKTATIID